MGGISIPQLLIIAAIVLLMFGSKKLRTLGSDLGASIKGFKKSMSDDDDKTITQAGKEEDADFAKKSISTQQPTQAEEQKTKEKEQG